MSSQKGMAPAPESGFPFGKSFFIDIGGGNYPNDAILVIDDDQGTPIVRYRVGLKKRILEQIVAMTVAVNEEVQFEFTLDSPTPAQIAEGYIAGKYTFSFLPPGGDATSFNGTLKDPHKPHSTGEEDEWTAKGGGSDDDETSQY